MARWWWDASDVDGVDAMQDVGCLPTWLIALVIPAALAWYGIACIVERSGILIGRMGGLRLLGGEAVALGLASIFGALFLHARFGWSRWPGLRIFSELASVGALLGFVAALGFIILRIMMI